MDMELGTYAQTLLAAAQRRRASEKLLAPQRQAGPSVAPALAAGLDAHLEL